MNEQNPVTQEKTTKDEKKKKGSFWNKVKKGVESTTGLDISTEMLFVYPEIGKWKMTLKSAVGNTETGEVKVTFGILPLDGQGFCRIKMDGVIDGNGKTLKGSNNIKASDKIDLFAYGSNSVELQSVINSDLLIRSIYVQPGMKSIKSIKFTVNSNTSDFEARDIPITWTE